MYYGNTPFHLRPIELEGRSSANGSAWPVANPVLTCASATHAGYPSNFVADPFLYLQVSHAPPSALPPSVRSTLALPFPDVRMCCEIAGFFRHQIVYYY
jgi:hypothetical protein